MLVIANCHWSFRVKKRPWRVRRCKCGRHPLRGQGQCRRCRNEANDRWERRHPRTFPVLRRAQAMSQYRRLGLLPRGNCECGRLGITRLIDITDPQSAYFRCRSCLLKDAWRRRWALAGKPPPKPKRKLEFSPEHMAKLNAGLQRWRAERALTANLAPTAVPV